jgi:hypothetical protein
MDLKKHKGYVSVLMDRVQANQEISPEVRDYLIAQELYNRIKVAYKNIHDSYEVAAVSAIFGVGGYGLTSMMTFLPPEISNTFALIGLIGVVLGLGVAKLEKLGVKEDEGSLENLVNQGDETPVIA